MYPMDISRTVRLIIKTCLQVRAGQEVLIIGTTDEDLKLASALAAEVHAAGAEPGVVLVERPIRKVEPPDWLAKAMTRVDRIITLGLTDFGHTQARKEATAAGVSYAYIPDLMNEELTELGVGPRDLYRIRDLTLKVAEAISEAGRARITSPAGTDLELDLKGRPGLPLQPVREGPGHFAIVPFYSEVACAPRENRARGVVAAQGTVVGLPGLNGVPAEPIRWEVEKGRVRSVEGGREARTLAKMLPKLGKNADALAELGIGTNPKMRDTLVGNRRDNAIFGHIHLALGRNLDLGGTLASPIHTDFLVLEATLELDGQKVLQGRRWLG